MANSAMNMRFLVLSNTLEP